MGSSRSTFDHLFGNLKGVVAAHLAPSIQVGARARDIDISNNQFNTNVSIHFGSPPGLDSLSDHAPLQTAFRASMARNPLERGQRNVELLEHFIFDCNAQGVIPTVRTYSLFSHISSVRSRHVSDEHNSLVLAEKDLLDRMLELKFQVRFIVSLDLRVILTAWGSTLDSASARMAGLVDQVDRVASLDNVEIVVDDINAIDNQFILHDGLLIRAMNIDPSGKYDFTKYEVNEHVIANAIRVYDERFMLLRARNQVSWDALGVTTWSGFIRELTRARVEAMYSRVSGL